MEYSWKIDNIDEVSGTMTVSYTFNTSYPTEPILVNMTRCPAGMNVNEHVRTHAPTSMFSVGSKFNNSAVAGLSGIDSVYVENIVKLDTLSLDDYKKLKYEELAAKRYEHEVGGIYLGTSKIDTSRSSQAILTAAYISIKNGLIPSVDWKDADGTWNTLGLAEIEAVSTAVSTHVQAAFTKEKDLMTLVAAATSKPEVDSIVW